MRLSAHEILGFQGQCHDDLTVDTILGERPGFYVNMGTNDPAELNNILRFHKRGQNGINIDPLPPLFEKIHKHRPRDINLNLAV